MTKLIIAWFIYEKTRFFDHIVTEIIDPLSKIPELIV